MQKAIPYGRQYISDTDIAAVVAALKSDFMTQGPLVEKFENTVANYHNAKFAVAFSNGTAALHAAYYAVGLVAGDEFITSPLTFVASANGGVYLGGIPRFVDIDSNTYNLAIDRVEEQINPKTKVVTPVSYAGRPVDMKSLRKIADKQGLKIIHDAAHAIGAKFAGQGVADFSDATVLSFHPVKHIATGEGGMVLTNDPTVYERLNLFRTHGITKDSTKFIEQSQGAWYYEMQELGFNYRLTDLQSALGIAQMERLNWSLYERNKIARFYQEELQDLAWIDLPTKNMDLSWLTAEKYHNLANIPEELHSFHLYPILVENEQQRLELFNYLKKHNINVQVHYVPVHLMPYYQKKYGFKSGDFPIAENFYRREISLPMFPTLTLEDRKTVVQLLRSFS